MPHTPTIKYFLPYCIKNKRNICLANLYMIKDGLLPTIDATEDQINEALAKLSPQNRKLTTRKFRKKWRKISRKINGPLNPRSKRSVVESFYLTLATHGEIIE